MKSAAFSKTYAHRCVLRLPELTFAPGKIYAVIGANGSGKSTLARVLAGILPADGPKYPLDGGVSVGYMPQKSYAFRMNTYRNVCLAEDNAERAAMLMQRLGLLPFSKQPGNRLSGGETAKMALARILMKPYDLAILDEPTAAMDMESTVIAETLIREYHRAFGGAVLLVTHSLQQARRIADEVLFLHNGMLVEQGPANQVLYRPKRPETQKFLNFYGSLQT